MTAGARLAVEGSVARAAEEGILPPFGSRAAGKGDAFVASIAMIYQAGME